MKIPENRALSVPWRLVVVSVALAAHFCVPRPAAAADLRSISLNELLDVSSFVCRVQLVGVEEISGHDESEFRFDSKFRVSRSLRGACPEHITIKWKSSDLVALDQVGGQWYLFLAADGAHLSSSHYGAWKIEMLEALDWSKSRVEIVAPQSYSNVRGLPAELFEWRQFKVQYFDNLSVEFGARVIRTERLELSMHELSQKREEHP